MDKKIQTTIMGYMGVIRVEDVGSGFKPKLLDLSNIFALLRSLFSTCG